ncbi:MAG: 4'-phosphopantetheinyl transferase family protein [Gemmatimonas sp.]
MVAFTIISSHGEVARALLAAAPDVSVAAGVPHRIWNSHVGRAALHALLNRTHPGAAWRIVADGRGRPMLAGPRGPGPSVSISHTRGWIACAVADHPVGIDVEERRSRDCAAIADYAFGPRERDRVRHEGAEGFYRVWTVREAIAKATGDGLAQVIDHCDRAHDGPDEGRWVYAGADTWLLSHFRPSATISAAIAVLSRSSSGWDDEPFDEIRPEALV